MRLSFVWFCAAAVGAADFAAGLVGHAHWLSPSAQGSVFRWVGAATTLVAAGAAAALARRGRGWSRLALAAALVYVALDQALSLHQRLAADLDVRALRVLDWHAALLGANVLLLCAAGALLVREARLGEHRSALIVAGIGLLAVALGARFGGGGLAALQAVPAGRPRVAGEAAMHACGLAGWLLVAAGLVALTHDREASRDPGV